MSLIWGLIPGEVWAALGAALVAFAAMWRRGAQKKREGADEVLREVEEADRDAAKRIRKKLDDRDRSGSALERLRRLGKFRE